MLPAVAASKPSRWAHAGRRGLLRVEPPRYLLIIAGLIFGYWGYSLFRVGYYEKAGELKAACGDYHLVLKQVAPGVFFALFGAGIISVAIAGPIHVPRQLATAAQLAPCAAPITPNADANQGAPAIPKAAAKPTPAQSHPARGCRVEVSRGVTAD